MKAKTREYRYAMRLTWEEKRQFEAVAARKNCGSIADLLRTLVKDTDERETQREFLLSVLKEWGGCMTAEEARRRMEHG